MHVKLFWKNLSGGNPQEFEAEINAWLQQHPGIRVVDIKQSASAGTFTGSLWLLSVWYEEGAEPLKGSHRQEENNP